MLNPACLSIVLLFPQTEMSKVILLGKNTRIENRFQTDDIFLGEIISDTIEGETADHFSEPKMILK